MLLFPFLELVPFSARRTNTSTTFGAPGKVPVVAETDELSTPRPGKKRFSNGEKDSCRSFFFFTGGDLWLSSSLPFDPLLSSDVTSESFLGVNFFTRARLARFALGARVMLSLSSDEEDPVAAFSTIEGSVSVAELSSLALPSASDSDASFTFKGLGVIE